MATVKLQYGSTTESYWTSSSKITTPSVILTKGSSTVYIPILSGSPGTSSVLGDYTYTLGHLSIGGGYCPIARYVTVADVTVKVYYYYAYESATFRYSSGDPSWIEWYRELKIYAKAEITSGSDRATLKSIKYTPSNGDSAITKTSNLTNYQIFYTKEITAPASHNTAPPSDLDTSIPNTVDLQGVFKVTLTRASGYTLSASSNTSSKVTATSSAKSYSFTVTGTKS